MATECIIKLCLLQSKNVTNIHTDSSNFGANIAIIYWQSLLNNCVQVFFQFTKLLIRHTFSSLFQKIIQIVIVCLNAPQGIKFSVKQILSAHAHSQILANEA